MPVFRPLALALILLAGGCGRAPIATVVPTAEEQHLIDIICTDGFVLVDSLERDARGFLVVATRQGQSRLRYLLAAPAGQPLAIHPLEDRVRLEVADDGRNGTGPDARGLK